MRRREFVATLGGAATWPLAARAQRAGKMPLIGVLGTDPGIWAPWTASFEKRLGELGWTRGRTAAIEYRWAEGRADRLEAFAKEFVSLNVDVIVTEGTGAPIVKRATSVIPIVLAVSVDPVGSGLVQSLSHPGGNVTGLSNQGSDVAIKRLELLHDAIVPLRRLAIIANAGNPQSMRELADVENGARGLGIEVVRLEIRHAEGITPAFQALTSKIDALYSASDAFLIANLSRILGLALDMRLPTIFNNKDYVRAGALLSYGPSYPDLFRRAAEIVDKILKGEKPGDIPVEEPTKFELAVNLKTAKAIGVKVPQSLVSLADDVIE